MSEQATTIAKGQTIYAKRRYVGQYYVSLRRGITAHSNSKCAWKKDRSDYRRLPVFEEDGRLHWYAQDVELTGVTELCVYCPDTNHDLSWMDQGACRGSFELGFGDGDKQMIERFCNQCPVVLECFEYGAAFARDHIGTIWGGLRIPTNPGERLHAINKRRQELTST